MTRAHLYTAIILTVASGCGGSEFDDYQSGVSSSKTLGALSATEKSDLCTAASLWHFSVLETDCRFRSAFASTFSCPNSEADLRAVCKATHDRCVKDPVVLTCPTFPEGCQATVAEFEACTKDGYAALDRSIPSCDSLTLKYKVPPYHEPASCQSLAKKCPGYRSARLDILDDPALKALCPGPREGH